MGDSLIETIDLLDDRVQRFARSGALDTVLGELSGGAQTRERIAEAVRHPGRHLADGGQLLGLHQLRAGLTEPLGHLRKGARQVADLVEELAAIVWSGRPRRRRPWRAAAR